MHHALCPNNSDSTLLPKHLDCKKIPKHGVFIRSLQSCRLELTAMHGDLTSSTHAAPVATATLEFVSIQGVCLYGIILKGAVKYYRGATALFSMVSKKVQIIYNTFCYDRQYLFSFRNWKCKISDMLTNTPYMQSPIAWPKVGLSPTAGCNHMAILCNSLC